MSRKSPLLAAALVAAALMLPASAGAAKRSYTVERDIPYGSGGVVAPATPGTNSLDLYRPRGSRARGTRPVVVWIHGGGWRKGDKRVGAQRKAQLFTRAGFLFAAINYRLSSAPFDPDYPDPNRVMFPDHPNDVAAAIGWLSANVDRYGGNPRRLVLVGHSAGAHLAALVATAPTFLRTAGVRRQQIAGWVALDSPTYDIATAADPALSNRSRQGREMFWNAFGAPSEPGSYERWRRASPIRFADPYDPPGLLVTQEAYPERVEENERMALALGRDPLASVIPVPLDHREINRAVGVRSIYPELAREVVSFTRRVGRVARRR